MLPVGSRGKVPGQGSGGLPSEAEQFFSLTVWHFDVIPDTISHKYSHYVVPLIHRLRQKIHCFLKIGKR